MKPSWNEPSNECLDVVVWPWKRQTERTNREKPGTRISQTDAACVLLRVFFSRHHLESPTAQRQQIRIRRITPLALCDGHTTVSFPISHVI